MLSRTLLPLLQPTGPPPGALAWWKADAITDVADGGPVAAWPDSSGNLRAATGAGAARPTWRPRVLNGLPGVRFAGAQLLATPSYQSFPAKRGAIYAVVRPRAGAGQQELLTSGHSSGSSPTWIFYCTPGGATYYKWFDGVGFVLSDAVDAINAWVLMEIVRDGDASLKFYRDGALVATTGTVANNQPAANVHYLGGYSAGGDLNADVAEIIEYPSEQPLARAYLRAKYNLAGPLATGQVVFDGDSMTADDTYPARVRAYLAATANPWDSANYGVSSQTVADMTTDAVAQIDSTYSVSRSRNVLCLLGGTNDLFFGADAATTYARIKAYCQARTAAGWRVVCGTIMSRSNGGTPGTFNADRATVNASIRANAVSEGWAVAVVDLAADPRIGDDGDETDATYFSGDDVHPNATGYNLIGDLYWAALSGVV